MTTRIGQRSFSGGVIDPRLYARSDHDFRGTAMKEAVNVFATPEGPAQSRGGTLLAGGYDTSYNGAPQFLIPFEASEDDTYMLEFGEQVLRVLKGGSYVLSSTQETVVGVTAANPAQLEMSSPAAAAAFTVGRLVALSDPNGVSPLHSAILEVTAISTSFITFKVVGGTTVDNTGSGFGGIGAGATLTEVYQVASPYALSDMPNVQFTQDVDTLIMASRSYDPTALVRSGDASWSFVTLTFEPSIGAPANIAVSAGAGTGSETYRYRVAAVDAETGEESITDGSDSVTNDLNTVGNYNTITWDAVTGALYYRVYRKYQGVYYYIATTEDLTLDDYNIAPDTAISRQTLRDPFPTSDDRPGVVAFIEQRLTLAASVNNPQAVEMSSSLAPFNFNRSLTPGASDAITFRMRAQKLNRVAHIIPAERPLILTAGAEWFISTTDDAPMKTGNFGLNPRTYFGSASTPPPIVAGGQLLHVTRDHNTIRSIDLEDVSDHVTADVTRLARHLFRGRVITSLSYASAPDNVVWVTTDDGLCYSLTYMPDEGLVGWTTHEFGGEDVYVHQVAVVTEGEIDRPYFVISRTLQGQTVTLVERLDDRMFSDVEDCYFVDCGLTYNGAAATEFRGLLHLRGEGISVLADGNVVDGVVVDDFGQVQLTRSASKISMGLGYDAFMVLLPADFGTIDQGGDTLGRLMATSEIAIAVVDTRGIAAGLEGGTLNEVVEFTGASPIPLATKTHLLDIDGDWETGQCLEVRQTHPLPMTIAAVAPSWDIEAMAG